MSGRGAAPAVDTLYCLPAARGRVEALAGWFRIIVAEAPPRDAPGFHLWADDEHLELRRAGDRRGAFVSVGELSRRAAQGGDLARACGVAAGKAPTVLDAMAGWGVDGLVLAGRGCPVTLVERLPALSALQADLARRCGLPAELVCGDGFEVLRTAEPDVVYLDPMFPERSKTSLPGKRMQWLAELAECDPRPLEDWLALACSRARQRVVLKRRRRDPAVASPDWRIDGRTVRYDVYRGLAGGQADGGRDGASGPAGG